MAGNKVGRLGNDEIAFLKANYGKISTADMAVRMRRSIGFVEKNLKLHVRPGIDVPAEVAEKIVVRQELRDSQKWKQIKKELADDELILFEEEYVGMMAQFKGDVLHTEEAQIFDAIKLEVLKSRNMVARRRALEDITRLEKEEAAFLGRFNHPSEMKDEDKTLRLAVANQINIAKQLEANKTTEWTKLQERVEKIRQALKSNRDQRIKEIDNKGKDFLSVLKYLQSRDAQEQAGRQIALTKLAGEREHARLSETHVYEDGQEDRPILSGRSTIQND